MSDLFIDNKYTKWYYEIIEKSKVRYDKHIVYVTERHHLIPSAIGGSNDENNLVYLDYRTHFICHWLLTKMVKHKNHYIKMWSALSHMRRTKNSEKVISSWQFEIMKVAASKANKNKIVSLETRAKLSVAGKKQMEELKKDSVKFEIYRKIISTKSKLRTKEQEKQRQEKHIKTIFEKYGVENVSQIPHVRETKSRKLKNRIFTEEHKLRLSISSKGKRLGNKNCMADEKIKEKVR